MGDAGIDPRVPGGGYSAPNRTAHQATPQPKFASDAGGHSRRLGSTVDWHKRATDFGPSLEHRIAREDFLADAAKAGLQVVSEPKILPDQYFIVLVAR